MVGGVRVDTSGHTGCSQRVMTVQFSTESQLPGEASDDRRRRNTAWDIGHGNAADGLGAGGRAVDPAPLAGNPAHSRQQIPWPDPTLM